MGNMAIQEFKSGIALFFLSQGCVMENKNSIRLKEIKGTEAYNSFCREIYSHTLPLYIERDDEAGGSGTLVTYGPLKGILTAPHAIASLEHSNHVWIPY